MSAEQVFAIYHKDCIDGTAAAAVVLRRFPQASVHPLRHSGSPEELERLLSSVRPGTDVYTVDCALGAKEFLEAGHRVITIDHHIGAASQLEALAKTYPTYEYVFDRDKSGASLCWLYLFPDEAVPELIKLVEDLDLWHWKYGQDTKSVARYLSMFLNNPEHILPLLEEVPIEVKEHGSLLSKFVDITIKNQTSSAKENIVRIGAHDIPTYNIVEFQSECGNILSKKTDSAVMLYKINGNKVDLEFRSLDHHSPNAMELAKYFGGGGHKNSAGAQILLKDMIKLFDVG